MVWWSLPSRGAWIEIIGAGQDHPALGSLPSRGAWIEIIHYRHNLTPSKSLPSRGAWIEIVDPRSKKQIGAYRRSPRGERGLKFLRKTLCQMLPESLPSRGAWIEIQIADCCCTTQRGRSPRGERGLKLLTEREGRKRNCVAPLAGSVD